MTPPDDDALIQKLMFLASAERASWITDREVMALAADRIAALRDAQSCDGWMALKTANDDLRYRAEAAEERERKLREENELLRSYINTIQSIPYLSDADLEELKQRAKAVMTEPPR